MPRFPIQVGQDVVLAPTGNNARFCKGPVHGAIIAVKRKYFYVRIRHQECRFRIDDYTYGNSDDNNAGWEIYPDEMTLAAKLESERKLAAIRKYFNDWRAKPDAGEINAIYEILKDGGHI